MSPNPLAMAPTNVHPAAVQGSPVGNTSHGPANQRNKQKIANNGGSPHHRKNKNARERNTPSPRQQQQQQRGSPKPKTSVSSSRRNYTPPPRFQKLAGGQFDGAFVDIARLNNGNTNMNNNFSSISTNYSEGNSSSDDSTNEAGKKPFAMAKIHSEAPGPETLPMPPSSWLMGCSQQAPPLKSISNKENQNDYRMLANELKSMLKVTL